MLKWIWDNGFAAVAGDHPSVEASPFQSFEWMLHQWLLSGWGCPLGELFDLERLGEECAKRKRWTFFFTSAPLRVSATFTVFEMMNAKVRRFPVVLLPPPTESPSSELDSINTRPDENRFDSRLNDVRL